MEQSLAAIARAHLRSHGLPEEIVNLIEVTTSPSPTDDGTRGNISIGYQSGGRRRETTIASMSSVEEAIDVLKDRGRIASIIALGLQAMPRSERPDAPVWVTGDDNARQTLRDMDRARGLANRAARGERPDRIADDARKDDGKPF